MLDIEFWQFAHELLKPNHLPLSGFSRNKKSLAHALHVSLKIMVDSKKKNLLHYLKKLKREKDYRIYSAIRRGFSSLE